MGFTLDKVVPWGRSYDEYISMFGLTEDDLTLRNPYTVCQARCQKLQLKMFSCQLQKARNLEVN